MTGIEKRRRALERRLRDWQGDALQLARDMGAVDPYVFVEPEGGVYIRDKAHPEDDDGSTHFGAGMKSAIVRFNVRLDAGAW